MSEPQIRANNFNLLRMIAASAVIVSHSFPLSLGVGTREPLINVARFSLGTAAVIAFFAISGYFITLSFERRKSNLDFIAARILRILPALVVVALLSAFIAGPLLTSLTLQDYLPNAWDYPIKVISLWQPFAGLPGVFTSNPYPNEFNAPLWTLFFEVLCYAGVFLIGTLGLLKRLPWLIVPYAALHAFAYQKLGLSPYLSLSLAFLVGMIAYQFPSIVNGWLALGLLAAALAFSSPHLWLLAIAVGVLWAGFKRSVTLEQYNRLGDYSYGVYVYGWPIQQMLVAAQPSIGPWLMMALTLPLAMLCGALSWHLVESPALKLRSSLPTRARPRSLGQSLKPAPRP